jgi:hypothetical protein
MSTHPTSEHIREASEFHGMFCRHGISVQGSRICIILRRGIKKIMLDVTLGS